MKIKLNVITFSPGQAKVPAALTSLVTTEGRATVLKCKIEGDPPLQVNWKKDSSVIGPRQHSSSSRFTQQSSVERNSRAVFAELKIDASEQADSGIYECIASISMDRMKI